MLPPVHRSQGLFKCSIHHSSPSLTVGRRLSSPSLTAGRRPLTHRPTRMASRSWMYGNRATMIFVNGLEDFCRAALEDKNRRGVDTIFCPSRDCNNARKWGHIKIIEDHLLCRGFKLGYEVWFWHGEQYPPTNVESAINCNDKDNEDDCGDDEVEFMSSHNFEVDENSDSEVDEDRMSDMLGGLENQLRDYPRCFGSVAKATETSLYPRCEDSCLLSAISELFSIKAKGNGTDSSFTLLLEALRKMFPKGNGIPVSTYYAKKLMCPPGLEYQRIL